MLKTYPHKGGVFHCEEYSSLGKITTLALLDRRAWKNSNDQTRDRLTESITITLNTQQNNMLPRLHKLQRINLDIDKIFKEHLLVWIKAQEYQDTPVHAACKQFLEYFQIDEKEYSLEAAYKYWQNQKKK